MCQANDHTERTANRRQDVACAAIRLEMGAPSSTSRSCMRAKLAAKYVNNTGIRAVHAFTRPAPQVGGWLASRACEGAA